MFFHEKEGLKWLSFELLDDAGVFNAVTLRPHDKLLWGAEKLSSAKQCHGDRIVQADDNVYECDALITQEKGRGIGMFHADCQIALFYDPVRKKVAAAHAGWRGNIARLYTKVIQRMGHPEDILVAISPSLGRAEFIHWESEWPKEFWHHLQGNYMDLWAVAEEELHMAGILPHHVQIARMCTLENPELFYSYRRDRCAERNTTMIAISSASV